MIGITDRRIRHMTEILTSIKMLKLYSWEDSFAKNVSSIRNEEVVQLRKCTRRVSLSHSLFSWLFRLPLRLRPSDAQWLGSRLAQERQQLAHLLCDQRRRPGDLRHLLRHGARPQQPGRLRHARPAQRAAPAHHRAAPGRHGRRRVGRRLRAPQRLSQSEGAGGGAVLL